MCTARCFDCSLRARSAHRNAQVVAAEVCPGRWPLILFEMAAKAWPHLQYLRCATVVYAQSNLAPCVYRLTNTGLQTFFRFDDVLKNFAQTRWNGEPFRGFPRTCRGFGLALSRGARSLLARPINISCLGEYNCNNRQTEPRKTSYLGYARNGGHGLLSGNVTSLSMSSADCEGATVNICTLIVGMSGSASMQTRKREITAPTPTPTRYQPARMMSLFPDGILALFDWA